MSRLAIPSLLFVLVGACSTTPAVSTASHRIHTAEQARLQGFYVPAGTHFGVRLDQAIGTNVSTRGDRFSAMVLEPLADTSGVIVVPQGARIIGRITSVEGTTGPRIHLALEQIETIAGQVPIHARLETSGAHVYPGQPEFSMVLIGDDSLLGARHAEYSQRAQVYAGERIGGGPTGYFYRVYSPREVIVPAGATLDLQLTRPLPAPGTQALRR